MMIALMPLPLGADPCLLHDYRCNCPIPSTNVDVDVAMHDIALLTLAIQHPSLPSNPVDLDLLLSNNDVVSCGNQS
jgi:hypothetical protein